MVQRTRGASHDGCHRQVIGAHRRPLDFSALTAIVTGSTSGIGLGIARVFGDMGMDVMLNGCGDAAASSFARVASHS
jgi:hypothetical protein